LIAAIKFLISKFVYFSSCIWQVVWIKRCDLRSGPYGFSVKLSLATTCHSCYHLPPLSFNAEHRTSKREVVNVNWRMF